MDLSNSSSLFEVFLGLNLACALVDKFSRSIYESLVGQHLILKNINIFESYKKKVTTLKENIVSNSISIDIENLSNEIDNVLTNQKELLDNGPFNNVTHFSFVVSYVQLIAFIF